MPNFSWAVRYFPRPQAEESLAELYHENSKLFPELAARQAAQFSVSPYELFLASRGFRQFRTATRTPLPEALPSTEPLQDVMRRRRSCRDVAGAITLGQLATLLRQAVGVTALVRNEEHDIIQPLRAWPSAGGLYPLDTYVVASAVDGLVPGVYHYNPATNELERLPSRAPGDVLREGFFWQDFATTAALALVLVAVFERTTAKYGERGYRLVLLDAGHAGQNLVLTAEQLHLAAVPVAGFCDDSLAADLGVDGVAEAVVHAVLVGRSHE